VRFRGDSLWRPDAGRRGCHTYCRFESQRRRYRQAAAAVAGDNGLIDLERGVVVLLEAADGSLDERAEVGDVGGGGEAVVEVVGEGPHPDIVFCEDGTRGRGRPQELSDVLRARALL
jgi:hypothetical protein